jgi:polyisoprenoid-binding protein YceI
VRPLAFALAGGLVLAAALAARAGGARAYRLDPASRFEVRTKTAGLFGAFAHEHLIRAVAPRGEVTSDPASPGACGVRVTVAATTLEVADPGVDAEDRKKIDATLKGEDVLDVARYPEIRFESTRVIGVFPVLSVKGDLTLHGTTRSVDVAVRLEPEPGGTALRARGSFRVKTSEFGMTPYSAGLGTVRVADEVAFDFDARAVAAPR